MASAAFKYVLQQAATTFTLSFVLFLFYADTVLNRILILLLFPYLHGDAGGDEEQVEGEDDEAA